MAEGVDQERREPAGGNARCGHRHPGHGGQQQHDRKAEGAARHDPPPNFRTLIRWVRMPDSERGAILPTGPTSDYNWKMSHRGEIVILVTFCAALLTSCLFVFTRHNTFPYYCHHDEHRKVKQLFTRDFNFHHPQLLLLTTDLVRRARGQRDGYQQVVMSGRWVSATFAAASVVLLALLGWRAFGLLGAWCVGLSVAVCPILGLTAHFLKEDTALLLGLSASLLALALWHERPTSRRLIWLGLACGLAVSAKYPGALWVLLAIALVLVNPTRAQEMSWFRRLALLLLPAMLVFVAINHPLFGHLGSFIRGLIKGAVMIAHGRDRPADLPNFLVIEGIGRLSWQVLLLAGAGVLTLIAGFRRTCMAGWALLGTGLLFTGMQLLSPLGVPARYLLVPAVSLHALAGLGIVMLVELAGRNRGIRIRRTARLSGAVAAVGLVWVAIPVYRSMAIDAFDQADARAELIEWANATLGHDAKLAASHRTRLPGVDGHEPADPAIRFERDPITIKKMEKIGPNDLDEMRRHGITHIILQEQEWSQYLARSRAALGRMDRMHDPLIQNPEVVWRTPKRFKLKNRWLREKLVVLRL